MRTNPAVQFYGVHRVLQAYEDRQAAPFILLYGNQLLLKYAGHQMEEGKALLHGYLKSIQSPESIATYTLCVFDKVPSGGLNSKTPYDGSFNFKLHEPGEQMLYRNEMPHAYEELKAMILEMRAELNEKGEDKPAGIGAIISGIFDNPQVQTLIAQRLIGLVDNILPMARQISYVEQSSGLGKVAGADQGSYQDRKIAGADEHNYQEQIAATNEAWPVLFQADPDIGNHLKKLASLAEKNREQFLSLVGMLEKL